MAQLARRNRDEQVRIGWPGVALRVRLQDLAAKLDERRGVDIARQGDRGRRLLALDHAPRDRAADRCDIQPLRRCLRDLLLPRQCGIDVRARVAAESRYPALEERGPDAPSCAHDRLTGRLEDRHNVHTAHDLTGNTIGARLAGDVLDLERK